VDTHYNYVGFWARLAAYLIDGIIIVLPLDALNYMLFGTVDLEENMVMYFIYAIIGTLYFIILPTTNLQATLGKRVMRMKIVDINGNKITLGRSIGRYFAQALSHLIFFIGYLMIGFMKNKTGLHDLLAKTYVVYKQ